MAQRKSLPDQRKQELRKLAEIREILASKGFTIPDKTRKELEEKADKLSLKIYS